MAFALLCRQGLNPKSLIQPSETLPVKLTETHGLFCLLTKNYNIIIHRHGKTKLADTTFVYWIHI